MTMAPNGASVKLNIGLSDIELKHGEIITNEKIANAYPNVFAQIEEKDMDSKPQMLTEVPAPTPVAPETDKVVSEESSSDDDEAEPEPVEEIVEDVVEESKPSASDLDENYTKKQLIEMIGDVEEDTKKMNKGQLIDLYLAGL